MSLTLETIHAALPENGLFDGGWRFSPEPLRLTRAEGRFLSSLGHPLARFQQACDTLYQQSSRGTSPDWISRVLDAGKPDWITDLQKTAGSRMGQPRVIRPDLIVTGDGFALTELDSVPGGIGITAWLSRIYADAGFDVLGGRNGMIDGFRSVLPEDGAVLISQEAKDYRREMEWLTSEAAGGRTIEAAENHEQDSRSIYRFFEWFDWEAIPAARKLAEASASGDLDLTPPCKPHLEDKLWLALLWTPALRPLWEKILRRSHLERIRSIVPPGWIVDPSPLPPQAVLPGLEVNAWHEVAGFSQKRRQLVLKISGFHETAWGSRGVYIGHDLPQSEWSEKIHHALSEFSNQPWIVQRFREGRVIEHPVFEKDGSISMLRGRVRLCPYYFTDGQGRTSLGGVLATLAPADKKKIHGMRDAVLLPCVVE
ncbi:MAG: hypothetical protein EAZ84_08730 [Verrucomicrobia bacterium]|nr:MAG: hypothetical protein EAZ84_08730 [Verrucomicrobiota bacterium]TAE88739.1 MAG: hypothetical protein EAZ82_03300 [Verrucomicrobiota bacterium]TAF26540.1 MAG: hypothetical protein EAZ71_04825 [Verrucomicrobiota bacterium]